MTYTDIENIFKDLKDKYLAEEKKHEMDQNIMGTHMNDLDEVLEILHGIVDYSPTITPVIGKAKPNNFFLKQRGSGFNSDSDIVISKGRLAAGTTAYNTTFGFSYFDPQFFTKIILESVPTGTNAFDEGKYVFGIDSLSLIHI